MARPTTISTPAWVARGASATSARAMVMISADRIRSVRTAPEMVAASRWAGSSLTGFSSASWPPNISITFSAPSKQR
ncbi:hypothetical protein D3C87_1531410 [compost metagenome]